MRPLLLLGLSTLLLTTMAASGEPIVTGGVVGRPKHVDENDPEIREVIERGMEEFNKQSNSAYKHEIVNVLDVTKQLVAGIKYTIKAEVAPRCGEGQDCEFDLAHKKVVTFVVVHQAWMKDKHPEREWQFSFKND